jgi:hypothetical protein
MQGLHDVAVVVRNAVDVTLLYYLYLSEKGLNCGETILTDECLKITAVDMFSLCCNITYISLDGIDNQMDHSLCLLPTS